MQSTTYDQAKKDIETLKEKHLDIVWSMIPGKESTVLVIKAGNEVIYQKRVYKRLYGDRR